MLTERKFSKRSDFLKLNEQSLPLKKIYEYTKKNKASQNSTKIMIPKNSNFTSLINDFKNIKNQDINSIDNPKKSIKNRFLYSNNRTRNKNNNLILSNFTNTANSINSKKFNTMENRRNLSVNRIFKTKNTKAILGDRNPTKIKLLFPKLSTVNSFNFKNKEKYKTLNNYSNGNNSNSNSKYILNNNNYIFVSKKKSTNSSNYLKFNENKITLQKNIEFSLFTRSRFFSPKKKSNLKNKNSKENIYKTEKCKNNLINGFSSQENENTSKNMNKKCIKNNNYSDKKEDKNRIIKFRTILQQTPKSKKVRKSVLDFSTKYRIKDEKKDKSDNEYVSTGSNRLKSKNKKNDEEILEKKENKKIEKNIKLIDFPDKKYKTSKKENNYIQNEKIYLFKASIKNFIISSNDNSENDENESNRHINKKMTTKSCKNFTKTYDIAQISDMDKDNKLDIDKKNEMNNLENSLKKSTLDMKQILCNYYINKDEEKYINKKSLKINKLVKENNKSSHLFRAYTKEVKEYFYKNVVEKVTEKILDNFVPPQNNLLDSKNLEKEKDIFLTTLFNKILDKCHKNNFSFEEKIQYGKRILKNEKIEIKVNVKNYHILEMFDVYQTLYNQIVHKWNICKEQDLFYYKKMFKVFGSLEKKYSIRDFYIYKQHVKREYILNLDDYIFRRTIINDNNNRYKINTNINSEKILNYSSKKNLRSFKVFEKKKVLNSFNELDKKRLSFAYENRGMIAPDFNSKKEKKVSDESNPNLRLSNYSKLKNEFGYIKQKSFKKFAKMYRLPYEKNCSQMPKMINEANHEKHEHSCSSFSEKELNFKLAKKDLDNYNILKKNKKLFNMNFDNNENEFKKKYSRNYKNSLKMNDKYKTDSIAIKIANFDQLTKVASVIKTQEIEKDNPDVKIFEGFVDALLTRKMREFDYLLKNEEEALDRNINRQEISTGNTLLMYATQNNLKSIVELLLAKGADTNIQNKFGNSALHIAYKNDNIFIINLLFEYGADQKLKNNIGLLPFQMSKFINS